MSLRQKETFYDLHVVVEQDECKLTIEKTKIELLN